MGFSAKSYVLVTHCTVGIGRRRFEANFEDLGLGLGLYQGRVIIIKSMPHPGA